MPYLSDDMTAFKRIKKTIKTTALKPLSVKLLSVMSLNQYAVN